MAGGSVCNASMALHGSYRFRGLLDSVGAYDRLREGLALQCEVCGSSFAWQKGVLYTVNLLLHSVNVVRAYCCTKQEGQMHAF